MAVKGQRRTTHPVGGVLLLLALLSFLVLGSIGPWTAATVQADTPPSSPTPQRERQPDDGRQGPAPSPYYYSPGGIGGPEDLPVIGGINDFFSGLPAMGEGITRMAECIQDLPRCWLEALVGFIKLVFEPFWKPVVFILFSVVSNTGKDITVEAPFVRELMQITRLLSLALLAVVLMWGGFAIMMNRHLAAPYHELAELLPRVAAAVALIAIFPWLAGFLIDVNNALIRVTLHPDEIRNTWDELWQQSLVVGPFVIFWLAALVVGIFLAGQLIMRFVLLDILLVLAPVAIMLWVLPQTRRWHELWATLFPATVFQQAVQAWVLVIGFRLVNAVWHSTGGFGATVTGGAGMAGPVLLTGLTAIAVMLVALKVPGLLAQAFGWGYPQYNAILSTWNTVMRGSGSQRGGSAAQAAVRAGRGS